MRFDGWDYLRAGRVNSLDCFPSILPVWARCMWVEFSSPAAFPLWWVLPGPATRGQHMATWLHGKLKQKWCILKEYTDFFDLAVCLSYLIVNKSVCCLKIGLSARAADLTWSELTQIIHVRSGWKDEVGFIVSFWTFYQPKVMFFLFS